MQNSIIDRMLITGDLHGDTSALTLIAKKMQEKDCLFVAGDFGFIFRNNNSERCFFNDVDRFLQRKKAFLVFVDGNHENHKALNEYPVEEWMNAKVHRIRRQIIHVLRGEILEINRKKIFCFGGAFSIDRSYRQLNISYWNEEIPSENEYKNGIENLERCNFQIDFVISHTCPFDMISHLGSRHSVPEEYPLQKYLQWVIENTKQLTCWYFGHWHIDKELPQKCRAIYLDVVEMEKGIVIC